MKCNVTTVKYSVQVFADFLLCPFYTIKQFLMSLQFAFPDAVQSNTGYKQRLLPVPGDLLVLLLQSPKFFSSEPGNDTF